MSLLRKDTLCGLLFIAIAVGFGWMATGYDIGTARRMGPGFFPLLTAIVVGLFGLIILAADRWRLARAAPGRAAQAVDAEPPVAWRPAMQILASVMFFGATVSGLGLVPALLVTVFVSALSGENTLRQAAVVSVAVTALCAVVFKAGLGLKLPLLGPWLGILTGT